MPENPDDEDVPELPFEFADPENSELDLTAAATAVLDERDLDRDEIAAAFNRDSLDGDEWLVFLYLLQKGLTREDIYGAIPEEYLPDDHPVDTDNNSSPDSSNG